MKWFHHECSAKHDPKLQTLGASFGSEGLGFYWGLLEEIGQHSDTFHMKITGLSLEADNSFREFLRNPAGLPENPFAGGTDTARIPTLPGKVLSRILFTTTKRLQAVIDLAAELGLFHEEKWKRFNVLYSPSFEHRADDYTRRQRRSSDFVRTDSEHSPDNVPRVSEQSKDIILAKTGRVLLEQNKKQKDNRSRPERDMLVCSVPDQSDLSTLHQHKLPKDDPFLLHPSERVFQEYCNHYRDTVHKWNHTHRNEIDLLLSKKELQKLFCGGDPHHKLSICYQALNLQGEKTTYPELVLRALRLMLRASQRTRIVNPFGWLWTCLHGNGDGTTPWVQLLTPEEEHTRHSSRGPP